MVDENDTFDSNVFELVHLAQHRIKTMIDYEFDLLLGTYVADTVNEARVIRWDTVSPSWNTSDPIGEVGVNAFIRDDNYVYANAGQAGNIYFYNGETLETFTKVPGNYSSTAYGLVNPYAVGNLKGLPVFGFSNGSGNPAPQGVYVLGSYSRNYQKVMDLSFPISQDVTSGVEIGAIIVRGFDMYVSWKEGSNYGIDKIDQSNKYTGAYFETRMLNQEERSRLKTLSMVSANYNSLPASTGITFSYSVNGASYVDMTSVTNSILQAVEAELSVGNVGSLQIKVSFTVSGNSAPTMESLDAIIQ